MLANLKLLRILGLRFFLQVNAVKRLSQDTARGFYQTLVLKALFNIGFFEAFEDGAALNLERFADENDLDLEVLNILCDYLLSRGLLDRQGRDYVLTADGKLVAQFSSGTYQIIHAYSDVFFSLEELLRKQKHYGREINRKSDYVAKGSGAVGKLLAFPLMAHLITENKFTRVLDLGCGDASFLIDLCQRNDQVSGFGLDISPEAIEAGEANLAAKKINGKIQLFVSDMFKIGEMAEELSGMDAATSVYVLHELLRHNKAEALHMLRQFRTHFPGVRLLVCEVIRHTPDVLREKPGGIIEIQLFHGLSKQQIFSREEWREVFEQAGFENIEEVYFSSVRTAVFIVS